MKKFTLIFTVLSVIQVFANCEKSYLQKEDRIQTQRTLFFAGSSMVALGAVAGPFAPGVMALTSLGALTVGLPAESTTPDKLDRKRGVLPITTYNQVRNSYNAINMIKMGIEPSKFESKSLKKLIEITKKKSQGQFDQVMFENNMIRAYDDLTLCPIGKKRRNPMSLREVARYLASQF